MIWHVLFLGYDVVQCACLVSSGFATQGVLSSGLQSYGVIRPGCGRTIAIYALERQVCLHPVQYSFATARHCYIDHDQYNHHN